MAHFDSMTSGRDEDMSSCQRHDVQEGNDVLGGEQNERGRVEFLRVQVWTALGGERRYRSIILCNYAERAVR